MRLYLDSSVLVKLYKEEDESELMDRVVQRIDSGKWKGFSSKWSLLEIARALKKDRKPKDIITVDLEDLRSHKIKFISIDDNQISKAMDLIKGNNLYAADALHIATFKSIKKADLFLCDDRHFDRLREAVPVKRPSDLKL
ncbi:MAG: type II toxin-antitoxin system VapC family toxin [Euryarchaeota archaeon]|nr:type II toxin-antitoxin system VapC family toxin [Euryarchaeota archaeon]